MGTIIAIGGGEIGRPKEDGSGFYEVETTKIDKRIIQLSKKTNPKVLFIPTASSDSQGYCNIFKKHYQSLNCSVDFLFLIKEKLSKKEIENKILNSDIIYVGGGNTLMMMKLWRKLGVHKILGIAYKKNIILCGLSAGSICWFKYGNSDSRKSKNPNANYIKVKGLNLINALHCPHYDIEKERQDDLKQMMEKTSGVAIAIDNCAAIEIINNEYKIIDSKPTANAYKIYWKLGQYYKEKILKINEYQDLNKLTSKN